MNREIFVMVGRCEPGVIEALATRAAEIDDRLHIFEPHALAALVRR